MKSHRNATNQPLPYHRKRLIAFNYRFFFGFLFPKDRFYDHFHATADNTDNDRAYDAGQD